MTLTVKLYVLTEVKSFNGAYIVRLLLVELNTIQPGRGLGYIIVRLRDEFDVKLYWRKDPIFIILLAGAGFRICKYLFILLHSLILRIVSLDRISPS